MVSEKEEGEEKLCNKGDLQERKTLFKQEVVEFLVVLHVIQPSVKCLIEEGNSKARSKVHLLQSPAIINSRCLEKFRDWGTIKVLAHVLSQSLPICGFLSWIICFVAHVNFSSLLSSLFSLCKHLEHPVAGSPAA